MKLIRYKEYVVTTMDTDGLVLFVEIQVNIDQIWIYLCNFQLNFYSRPIYNQFVTTYTTHLN